MLQQNSADPDTGLEAPAPAPDAQEQAAAEFDPAWRAGRKLAEARTQRGWSLEEVSERIRVRREFLAALEQMNVKLLPGKAYALAFLRSYARELGLDERAIVDQFQDECALTREDSQRQIRSPASRPNRERPWLAAAAVAGLAVAFVAWRAVNQAPQQPATEAAQVSPIAPGQAASPPATVEARIVEIRAVSEAWLEARGPDGTVFLSRTLQPGEVYRPDPSPGWTLHARDGGAFEVYLNGQAAGLLGAPGMPVLGRPLDGIEPVAQASVATPRS